MSSHPTPDSRFSACDRAGDLTFAVELKFLIRHDRADIESSEHRGVRPFVAHRPVGLRNSITEAEAQLRRDTWEAVARAVDELPGIRATTSHQVKTQGLHHTDYWKTHWIVYKANSAVPLYLTYFHDDPDRPLIDASHPDFDKYVWTPVEICSPILYWDRKDEALSQLRNILQAVNKRFQVVSNPSCETHVHVGRRDGKFLSLRTMKKLATLLWLSEPILRGLKDPNSPNHDHHYTWSYSWRQHSRIALALGRKLPGGQTINDLCTGKPRDFDTFLDSLSDARPTTTTTTKDGDKSEWLGEHREPLGAIWRAADHKELGYILRGPEHKFRRLGFNFHALEEDPSEPGPRTIEFRFLEGFVDKTVVPAWARLCGELVDLATHQAEEWEFLDAVVLLLSMPEGWSLEAQFSAFMGLIGSGRVPKAVWEPLRAIIRKHYPHSKPGAKQEELARWFMSRARGSSWGV